MSRHARSEFWESLGLATLAAAAFLLARFATGVFAAAVFTGVGAGVTGMQVASAYDQWADMELAHKAATDEEPGPVYAQQVEAAKISFYLGATLGLFDLATAPAAFAKFSAGWRAGGLAGESMARGADAAADLGRQVASLTPTTPGGADILERAIDTLGLETVLAASPLSRFELLKIAGDRMVLHHRLMTTLFFTPTHVRQAFDRALDELAGRATRTLDDASLDGVIDRALTVLGPNVVLQRMGGWDKVIPKLGEGSKTARHLLGLRDVQLTSALQDFARANLPEPPDQTTWFERTGTKGSPLNDYDVSALGPYSSENRAKLRAFAAGYLGVGEAELKPLFKIDFFGDPTRLHLADYLTPAARGRVSEELGRFENELVLNRMLFEAIRDNDAAGAEMARTLMAKANISPVYKPPTEMLEDLAKKLDE